MQGRLVWALAPEDNADLQHLRAEGFRVRRCASLEGFDRQTIEEAMRGCDAALLMSDAASNCRAAWLAREMGLPLDLVAFMGPARRGELTALLQVGVDWVMRQDDTPAVLAAILRALHLRRFDRAGGAADTYHAIGPWALEDQGWLLRHRGGASLRLTVSERAILICLFEAPGHLASHAMLNQALLQGWRHARGRPPRDPKPRGIVSRLRCRGQQAGMEPPVESLRGYGYVWEV